MTDTTKMVIKIASGIAMVVIFGVKIVMAKKDKKEEPTTEEAAE